MQDEDPRDDDDAPRERPLVHAYIDESYEGQGTDDRYWLNALIVPEPLVPELERRLRRVLFDARERHADHVPDDVELHAYELFHGLKRWSGLSDKRDLRLDIYKRGLRALNADGVQIVACHVPRTTPEKEDHLGEHRRALANLLVRTCHACDQGGYRMRLIADDHHTAHQQNHDLFVLRSDPGFRTKLDFSCFEHPIRFVDSRSAPLVQAIDLVTFLLRRIEGGHDAYGKPAQWSRRLVREIEPLLHPVSSDLLERTKGLAKRGPSAGSRADT